MKHGVLGVIAASFVFGTALFFIPLLIVSPAEQTDSASSAQHVSKPPAPAETSSVNSSGSLPESASEMKANGPISLKLIDIYHNVTVTDWNKVKENVDGVYIKATEGTTYTDPSFEEYSKMAISKDIPIGFYHYFWPTADSQNSKQQADYFYNTIKNYKYEFYPVLDAEESNNLDKQTISYDIKAFCDEFLRISNEKVMIYCSPTFIDEYLDKQILTSYNLWIAEYNVDSPVDTAIWHSYDMWQYEADDSIPGIVGKVDGDIATNNIILKK